MDAYFDTIKASDRLYAEWKKHPRLIIACDFDDTVYDTHQKGHTFDQVIDLLKECKRLNFYVVMFTASKVERYPLIEKHMQELGIEIDGINKNVIELPFGNNGKIYANIFLDDRAGLFQAAMTLLRVIDRIKREQEDAKTKGEV
jgi:hypothetical protein